MNEQLQALLRAGVDGAQAIREAMMMGEFRQIMDALRRAIVDARHGGDADKWVDLESVFMDRCVISEDGKLYAYPYKLTKDHSVTLGEPKQVQLEYTEVEEEVAEGIETPAAAAALDEDRGDDIPDAAIAEALPGADGEAGLRYRVKVLESGQSHNRNFYPAALLRESAALFNGARVFVKSDREHIEGEGKDFNKLIGRLSEARFVAGKTHGVGAIVATLDLLAAASPIPEKIYEAVTRGMKDLFGFSIDARARIVKRVNAAGVSVREVKQFTAIHSLDLIIDPSAGGESIDLIESKLEDDDMKLKQKMLAALREANGGSLPAGLDEADEAAVLEAYRALGAADNGGAARDVNEAVRMVEARAEMREAVAAAGLPAKAKQRLRDDFGGREAFTPAEVREAIKAERDYLSEVGGGHIEGLGEPTIEGGEDRSEKVAKMLDGMIKGDGAIRSVKEAYIDITGDKRVTGQLRECDSRRLREAAGGGVEGIREAVDSTVFAQALGDALHRALVADYAQNTRYDVWRPISSVVPRSDFRANHLTRIGGYGDLPVVGEGDAYGGLASPTDEEATYQVQKRGGIETITLETIANDDTGVVMAIPRRMVTAAKRTLAKHVLDLVKDNANVYDDKALFHADHNNLATTALSSAAFFAARQLMMKQTEMNSEDRLGIPPQHMLVPLDLEETAYNLFRRDANNDPDFVQDHRVMIHCVWYWTDADNWYLAADPMEIPGIEVGFLHGNEEPELFIQDQPTQGSLFSHDQISYKIRQVYGAVIKDWRAFQGNIV